MKKIGRSGLVGLLRAALYFPLMLAPVIGEVQPPAPPDFFPALCEIVPDHDTGSRYTGYCQVSESGGLTVRYSHYDTDAFPRPHFLLQLRLVQHSVEFVPEHLPFIRAQIDGWGQTIIYPVSLDKQAEIMRRSKPRPEPVHRFVSWTILGTGGFRLSVLSESPPQLKER